MPFGILCAMSHKVPIIFPMMSITPSSAYPWAYTPCLLSHLSRLSATADHNVGDKPPPCGNPCLVVTVMYGYSLLTYTVCFSIRVIIPFFTALCIFHSSNAVLTAVLHGVLSNPVQTLLLPVPFLFCQQVGAMHFLCIFLLLPGLMINKKALRQTQTLRAKYFRPTADPLPGGAGRPKFNELERVTSFTYKPSLVRIDARNFELSW